jgi:hypothetical protein
MKIFFGELMVSSYTMGFIALLCSCGCAGSR